MDDVMETETVKFDNESTNEIWKCPGYLVNEDGTVGEKCTFECVEQWPADIFETGYLESAGYEAAEFLKRHGVFGVQPCWETLATQEPADRTHTVDEPAPQANVDVLEQIFFLYGPVSTCGTDLQEPHEFATRGYSARLPWIPERRSVGVQATFNL
jgi:hypothetical protein